MAAAALEPIVRPQPILDMNWLDRVIRRPDLLPPAVQARRLAAREYAWLAPGMASEVRVTTDPRFFDEHPESVELWSAGSPLFPRLPPAPEGLPPDPLANELTRAS